MTHPYRSIVILTGAGISAESGISTFRDPDGVWAQYDVEEVATPQGFRANPEMVHAFYNARRTKLGHYHPNAAHDALARLEAEYPGEVLLVTQNVDDLHDRAGSRNLIHMHGELCKVKCLVCGAVSYTDDTVTTASKCPACHVAGGLRPNVVWFGEMPFRMDFIYDALAKCDLFMSVGTSGTVYPAAGFVQEVRGHGRAHTVELNLEPSDGTSLFHETVHGPATQVVPTYVEALLTSAGC